MVKTTGFLARGLILAIALLLARILVLLVPRQKGEGMPRHIIQQTKRAPGRLHGSLSNPDRDMQALLIALRPPTTSAALNALRRAFPHVPLSQRVSACEAYARAMSD